MTEISVMELTPARRRFVLHWGEMGSRWGINRTVAQVHALLFVSERPLHAEEVCEVLSVARSNVSVALRELQAWGLVRVAHLLGDRRDYFEATADVWEMFQVILDGRRRREVDPMLAVLRECVAEAEAGRDAHALARLSELLGFLELTLSWFDQVRRMPRQTLTRFARMGSRVTKLLAPAS
jgi:DNA-binding transcriptional regulator GbsR (MarR family)